MDSSPSPTATITALESDYERILGLAPVMPANVDLFTTDYLARPVYPEAYPDGSPMLPAASAPTDAPTVRSDLNEFLVSALGAETSIVQDTLSLFDSPEVQARVPDPRLRAAFVLLNLTIAQPAIETFLTSPVYGGTLDWMETGRAYTEATRKRPDGSTQVEISDIYRFEHFAHVAPNIAHALNHHDEPFSYPEDVMALTVATIVYLQLVDLQPSVAHEGTELSRINNTFGMALLNSHRPGDSEIQLIVPGGTSVLPGSPEDAEDFWSLFAALDDRSPAPPNYDLILDKLLTPETELPEPLLMNRALVELVSGNISQEALSDTARVRLWVLLTMTSTDEIAAMTELTRDEVIERFQLQDIESVIASAS